MFQSMLEFMKVQKGNKIFFKIIFSFPKKNVQVQKNTCS